MKRIYAVFLAFLILSYLASAISSEEALSRVNPLLNSGEQASVLFSFPLKYKFGSYWIVEIHPQLSPKSKNLVVVVSDSNGHVMTDTKLIKEIYKYDYEWEVLQNVRGYGTAPAALNSFIGEVNTKLDNFDSGVGVLEQYDYSFLKTSKLNSELKNLRDDADTSSNAVYDLIDSEQNFMRDYSSEELDTLLSKQKETMKGLNDMCNSIDSLSDEIDSIQKDALNANITQDEKQSIYHTLQNMNDFTSIKQFQINKLQPAIDVFDALMSANETKINDYIESFIFRKTAKNALSQVDRVKEDVQQILQNKAYYSQCSRSVGNLESSWKKIDPSEPNSLTNPSTATLKTYLATSKVINGINTLIKKIKDDCSKPTAAPSPKKNQQSSPIVPIIILIVVVGAAVFIYKYYKKQQSEENEEIE